MYDNFTAGDVNGVGLRLICTTLPPMQRYASDILLGVFTLLEATDAKMVDSISRDSNEGIAITNSHLNPLIRIITWLLLAISSLMLGFRFLTRMYLKSNREFGLEDIMVILAFVCTVYRLYT